MEMSQKRARFTVDRFHDSSNAGEILTCEFCNYNTHKTSRSKAEIELKNHKCMPLETQSKQLTFSEIRDQNIKRNEAFLQTLEIGRNDKPVRTMQDQKQNRRLAVAFPTTAAAHRERRQPIHDQQVLQVPGSRKDEFIVCNICQQKSHLYSTPIEALQWLEKHKRDNVTCKLVIAGEAEVSGQEHKQPHRMTLKRKREREESMSRLRASGGGIWKCKTLGCEYEIDEKNARAIKIHLSWHTRHSFKLHVGKHDRAGVDVQGNFVVEHLKNQQSEEEAAEAFEFFDDINWNDPGCLSPIPRINTESAPYFALETADQSIFLHQAEIEKIISNPLNGSRNGKNVEATLEICSLGLALDVTVAEGQQLLNFANKYIPVEPGTTSYTSWKGLMKGIGRQIKSTCELHCVNIPLPVKFFGDKDDTGAFFKSTKGFFYPLQQRLGEALLAVNPNDFEKDFSLQKVSDSIGRVYSSFATGLVFQRMCLFTHQTQGENVTPICVGFFYDEASATKNVSKCPLVGSILNLVGDSYKPFLLGYCPLDLAYSDAQLHVLLKNRGLMKATRTGRKKSFCPTKITREKVISFAKRNTLLEFLNHVLSPLDSTTVYHVQLGMGQGKVELACSLHVGPAMGDLKAQNELAGIGLLSAAPCIHCNSTNMASVEFSSIDGSLESPNQRDPIMMGKISNKLGEIFLNEFLRECGLLDKPAVELLEKEAKFKEIGRKFGLIGGPNPVRDKIYGTVHKHGIYSFYRALCVEFVHTLWKGFCEDAIAWCLHSIFYIAMHSKKLTKTAQYADALGMLDTRIAQWLGSKESLEPVELHHLEGVSKLLKYCGKKGTKSKRLRGTGIISGSIPACHLPGICLQLLFCIGCEGAIVPNDLLFIGGVKMNPTQRMISTFAAVLECCYFAEADILNEAQLRSFRSCIQNAHLKLIDLDDMRRRLARIGSKPAIDDKSNPAGKDVSKVVKFHNLIHVIETIEDLGANSRAFNTQIGEKSHQHNVKGAYRHSSRVLETTIPEMCSFVVRNEIFALISKGRDSKSSPHGGFDDCEEDDDSEGDAYQMKRQEWVGGRSETCLSVAKSSLQLSVEIAETVATMTYKVVTNHGSVVLKYDQTNLLRTDPQTTGQIQFLNPLCERSELFDQIVAAYLNSKKSKLLKDKDEFLESWYENFIEDHADFRLRLVGAVKCDGDATKGMKPCTYRANNNYIGNGRNRQGSQSVFSNFEIEYGVEEYGDADGEQTTFGKIFALVVLERKMPLTASHASSNSLFGFRNKFHDRGVGRETRKETMQWERKIFVCFARFVQSRVKQKTGKMTLPFDEYKLECKKKGHLGLDFISVDSIRRPCFMCVSSDASATILSKLNFDSMRWYCLSSSQCVKNNDADYSTYRGDVFQSVAGMKLQIEKDGLQTTYATNPELSDDENFIERFDSSRGGGGVGGAAKGAGGGGWREAQDEGPRNSGRRGGVGGGGAQSEHPWNSHGAECGGGGEAQSEIPWHPRGGGVVERGARGLGTWNSREGGGGRGGSNRAVGGVCRKTQEEGRSGGGGVGLGRAQSEHQWNSRGWEGGGGGEGAQSEGPGQARAGGGVGGKARGLGTWNYRGGGGGGGVRCKPSYDVCIGTEQVGSKSDSSSDNASEMRSDLSSPGEDSSNDSQSTYDSGEESDITAKSSYSGENSSTYSKGKSLKYSEEESNTDDSEF